MNDKEEHAQLIKDLEVALDAEYALVKESVPGKMPEPVPDPDAPAFRYTNGKYYLDTFGYETAPRKAVEAAISEIRFSLLIAPDKMPAVGDIQNELNTARDALQALSLWARMHVQYHLVDTYRNYEADADTNRLLAAGVYDNICNALNMPYKKETFGHTPKKAILQTHLMRLFKQYPGVFNTRPLRKKLVELIKDNTGITISTDDVLDTLPTRNRRTKKKSK